MTLLALMLPGRARLMASGEPPGSPRPDSGAEWSYVLSRDGLSVDEEGSAPVASLPKAERIVLVAQDEDVAWLPTRLPKAAAARLKEALAGALEEQLLEDPAQAHLAVSRQGLREDDVTWVAALHKPWIEQALAQLQEGGVVVDGLVSLSEPTADTVAHAKANPDGHSTAVVSGPHGVALWSLEWLGWKERLPQIEQWTSEPSVARTLADQDITAKRLVAPGPRALAAAAAHTNLLQFDLTPRMKGSRAVLAAWATFKEPRLRVLRWGLVALLLIQVVGLNISAWQARRDVLAVQARGEQLLREAFPSVKVVVDPAVQMERELTALRRASGQPGPTDLETWIDLLAGIWAGQPEPLIKLQWDTQGLKLDASQWPAEFIPVIEDHARQQGWQARLEGNTLRLSRSTGAR